MKYVIVLGDGMSDRPIARINHQTPLNAARKPILDSLCRRGVIGRAHTIPPGMPVGSETANLSILGYDPTVYFTGRSPLEAVALGIDMHPQDVAFRCNLVTLTDEPDFEARTMLSHSSGGVGIDEGRAFVEAITAAFPDFKLYAGASYRHILIDRQAVDSDAMALSMTPPHDIADQVIGRYLPQGPGAQPLIEWMKNISLFLQEHPLNQNRRERGLPDVNAVWLWGQGKKPLLPGFDTLHHLRGAVISAVPLIHGIGVCAGLTPITVPGATGDINTNWEGKAAYALKALQEGADFVYVHAEAPDECGHDGNLEAKVRSIEYLDQRLLRPLLDGLAQFDAYRIMVLSDHATPVELRTHTADPVPYCLYDSRGLLPHSGLVFTEDNAACGDLMSDGTGLIRLLFEE